MMIVECSSNNSQYSQLLLSVSMELPRMVWTLGRLKCVQIFLQKEQRAHLLWRRQIINERYVASKETRETERERETSVKGERDPMILD